MNWQETIALGIVAATTAAFLLARRRARRGALPCESGCGCSAQKTAAPQSFHARRARAANQPTSTELPVAPPPHVN